MSENKTLTPQILAMYLGCRMQCTTLSVQNIGTLRGICERADGELPLRVQMRHDEHAVLWFDFDEVKPILRRLEDMTQEECNVFNEKGGTLYTFAEGCNIVRQSAESVLYLLSKHFDLFGLIDAGLAIDAKTLQPHQSIG